MANEPRFFADTTVIYYLLSDYPLLVQAVWQKTEGARMALSNFVRGEYIRGFIVGLIELYYSIKEENNVQNGIYIFIADKGRAPRMVANALQSVTNWLCGLESHEDVPTTLRRLGEYIRGRLILLDATFPTRSRDHLDCDYGVLNFPAETYDEQHILDFYEQYDRIAPAPTCRQCEFRRAQQEKMAAAGIDLYGAAPQARYKDYKGYVTQAKNIDRAVRSPMTDPSCWHCTRLGDTIIALSAPDGVTILTGDKQSFPAFGEILDKPVALIPSLKELRQQRDQS